ncbi:hypothetical protein F0L17_00235 [Streptomyces sp. TRM43335]|uniref:Alpha-L-arabinofuranosidase 1 catalytic domain-containing protein n=1 Tax=Streptomyces taklimakanensis TaxID=2569853 RepID=A0A6G2B6Q7_9ACTN|nr:hypothetical protein [Streptomyces taklimakanensis]MTE17592.1 hypothetical protein [Streptomyces taklimakanensis]
MPRAHIEFDRRQAVIASVRRRTFGSGVRREDSVGPREKRPVRRDLAWRSLEPNRVGLDEFARWLKLTGSESMPAVDVAARGVLLAPDLLEYADHPSDTTLSDPRIANGTPDPHDVRMWCVGDETDEPWRIGSTTADDHAEASVVDAVATVDEGRAAVFLVNRDLAEAARVTIDVRGPGFPGIAEAVTFAERHRATPAANSSAALADGLLDIELPPVSWTAGALR